MNLLNIINNCTHYHLDKCKHKNKLGDLNV